MKNPNAEAFISKWWSASSSTLLVDVEDWMAKTYNDVNFWKDAVFAEQEGILPKSPTIFGKSYNFYHDCVIRYIHSNTVAFSVYPEKNKADNWTHERLHHCVNFHIDKWSYHSPQPGQLMAIVASSGIHFLISMLTALRFGLKICYLPTNSPFLGKGQIEKLISEIKPDLIAAEESSFSVEGIPTLTVNEKAVDEENHSPQSFAYPAATDILTILSMQEQTPFALASLDSQTLYLHCLRDGLFTFNLLQHPYWATPLACPIRTEPFNTLMSLLFGINRIYVSDEVIRKDPFILQDERVSLLGISSELQQLWTKVQAIPTRYLKSCYRSSFDTNSHAWKAFVQLNKLEKVPSFQVLVDNAIGAVSLSSKPSLETYNIYLKPTVGTSWKLNQMNGSGETALNGFGVFTTHKAGDKTPEESNFTASLVENNLMMTGFIHPCREGMTMPVDELEEIVQTLPFVEGCMIYPMLKTGSSFSRHFVLLVFVSPMKQEISEKDTQPWSTEIHQKITQHLGSAYLPDHVEYFPLLPKTSPLGINRAWCMNQFDSGLLRHKKNFPPYQTLTVLKKLVKQATK